MSKFKEPTPPDADDKVIAFPAAGEMALEQRKAELEVFSRAAGAELMLRIKYSMLKTTLDTIDKYDPVPDDWRARLEEREPSCELDGGDEDEDAEDEGED